LKNLYSDQTSEDSFLETPHSSGVAPTQTSSGSQVGEDMDVDQSSEIAPESSMFSPYEIVPRFAEHVLTIPALPSYTPKNTRSRLLEMLCLRLARKVNLPLVSDVNLRSKTLGRP
jgi:hypothetical protein